MTDKKKNQTGDDPGEQFRKWINREAGEESDRPTDPGAPTNANLQEGDTGPLQLSSTESAPPVFGGESEPARTTVPGKPASVSTHAAPTWPGEQTSPASGVQATGGAGRPPAQPAAHDLPRPAPQVDTGATHVSPAAYQPPDWSNQPAFEAQPPYTPPKRPQPQQPYGQPTGGYPPIQRPPAQHPAPPYPPAQHPAARRRPVTPVRPPNKRSASGCVLRTIFVSLFALVLVALCVLTLMFYEYYRIAATLPGIADLRQRAAQFETTRILDRNGDLLYEILDPSAGRRTYVTLDQISPYLVAAVIATEDKGFYAHPGFDVTAIVRAFWQNYQSGETVSGASTITQQLARNLLMTPEERSEQSYQRKMREAILAAEITRRYSKNEILELYLNEVYFGNLAYGVQAASETYFRTQAGQLDLGQSSFLAGLPQAPAIYDIYTNPEATLARQKDVLALMYQLSQEQGCIYVSNAKQRVCVDAVMATNAATQIQQYSFKPPDIQIRYPHWVNYVRAQLEATFDAQTIYRAGFTVYTTLDPKLQDEAQEAVSQQVATMGKQNAQSGALVAIQPTSGEILAMVGSADFYNEAISGQVNMAVSPRQPGSSIKPLTYLAAFEKGWTPATLIWDVPTDFTPSGLPNDPGPTYTPVNYDGLFHGPVTVRTALANSYNIPAVKALQFVGIYDDPAVRGDQGFIAFAKRMGITTLTREDYGLSLTLGGGEVSLLELSGAFSTIANRGLKIPLVAITKIVDYQGEVRFEQKTPQGEQVIRPEHAYLITSILSDNAARQPAFGRNNVLELPFQAAVKTGTTNDFRDNWTIGFTPNLVVGVWVGNPDYTPMKNTTGLSGAAPIWSSFMQTVIRERTGGSSAPFTPPQGIMEQTICAISGTLPSQWCPKQRREVFAVTQPPLSKENDLWQKVALDTWTGLRASSACAEFTQDRLALNVSDASARKWIRKTGQGQAWASQMGFDPPISFVPSRECRADDPRPSLNIVYPADNTVIQESSVDIYALASASNGFEFWQLSYGEGQDPHEWQTLAEGREAFNQPEVIYQWDLSDFTDQIVTLRLFMKGPDPAFAERKIRLLLQAPEATATPLPPPTDTPPPTELPPTSTVEPYPILTPAPTETPLPTAADYFLPIPTWPFWPRP